MSAVDIKQPFSPLPAAKRPRETITLACDGSSKCAEIFVTNNADKWTFFCSYCQKATSDIGVFICHIKMEHLNAADTAVQPLLISSAACEQQTNVAAEQNEEHFLSPLVTTQNAEPADELMADASQLTPQSDIIKEEVTIESQPVNLMANIADVSALDQTESVDKARTANEKENVSANKNANTTTPQAKPTLDETIFTMIPIYSEAIQQQQQQLPNTPVNNGVPQVVYVKNEADEAENDCENTTKKIFICPYCSVEFQFRISIVQHMKHKHNKKFPTRCGKCNRGFRTASSLKLHMKTHNKNNRFQCPVCDTKLNVANFITHVLKHQSDTCFPCQVCATVFPTQEERMEHWQTHAKDKPYACRVCYRRWAKMHFLTRHLRVHNKYQCNYCPALYNFAADGSQLPNVCPECKNLNESVAFEDSLLTANLSLALNMNENADSFMDEIDGKTEANVTNVNGEDASYMNETYEDTAGANDSHVNVPSASNVTEEVTAAASGSNVNVPLASNNNEEDASYMNEIYEDTTVAKETNDNLELSLTSSDYSEDATLMNAPTGADAAAADKQPPLPSNLQRCPHCPRESVSAQGLLSHITKTHDKIKQQRSRLPTRSARARAVHVAKISHDKKNKIPNKARPYNCQICGRSFFHGHVLRNHMKVHRKTYKTINAIETN